MERVCIVGAGVIGSLFAGHLSRVCEVSVLTRRREHADALNEHGLRVSGLGAAILYWIRRGAIDIQRGRLYVLGWADGKR